MSLFSDSMSHLSSLAMATTGTSIAVLFTCALIIDHRVLVSMFLKRPSLAVAANWLTSAMFSFCLLMATMHYQAGRYTSVSLTTGLALPGMCATLAYLLVCFGGTVIAHQLARMKAAQDSQQAASASSSTTTTSNTTSVTPTSTAPPARLSSAAFVVVGAGVLLGLSLVVGFAFHMLPVVWASVSGATPVVMTAAPWVLTVAVAAVWFLRESHYQGADKRAVDAILRDTLDKERLASYPNGYPNGWYKLIDSAKLPKGTVKHMTACGQQFAVYRGKEDGKAHVLDAYCPHLGANMAVGGTVEGDRLTCPFHGWSFNGDGSVGCIPYSTANPPKQGAAHSWPCMEYYGQVLVYYDVERRDPPYNPPAIPDIDSGKMVHRGTHMAQDVRMHIQEFAENSTDFAHFEPLHGDMIFPWSGTSRKFLGMSIPRLSFPRWIVNVHHDAGWKVGTEEEGRHIAHFLNHATLRIFGILVKRTEAFADITFVGPAGVVFFRLTIPDLGSIIVFQTHRPKAPMLLATEFSYFADAHIPRLLVSYVVGNWVSQWAQDLMVWENKMFSPKPILVKGDGPMFTQRRWYKQFYSSGKPKVDLSEGESKEDGEKTAAAAANSSAPAPCPAASPSIQW